MDAVTAAVTTLENNPLFNAGKGSVFNHLGRHEMDASIIDGKNRAAGAVTCVTGVKNPVPAGSIGDGKNRTCNAMRKWG